MARASLNQVIYYYFNDQIQCSPVLSILEIQNAKQDLAHTKVQERYYMRFGPSGVKYATCHGEFDESEVALDRSEFLNLPITLRNHLSPKRLQELLGMGFSAINDCSPEELRTIMQHWEKIKGISTFTDALKSLLAERCLEPCNEENQSW